MYKFFIIRSMNNCSYWLKNLGKYGDLVFAEWTTNAKTSMKFETKEKANELIEHMFKKRKYTVKIDERFDAYSGYDYYEF